MTHYKQHPKLIIEILSESTEAFDRGQKFHHYRELGSLQEYVLVNQTRADIEIFRRTRDRAWNFEAYSTGETVPFHSLDFTCAVAEIYEDVALKPEPEPPPMP
jgi:Uma2 family endonuclease